MGLTFTKASKAKAKARIAIYGPAGSGKTFTALSLAAGLAPEGTRVAVVDTEHGAASKYADRFDFDTLNLGTPRVEAYVEAIKAAEDAGYGVIVLDSISHGWQTLLEEVDKSSRASSRKNTWAAWRDHTPRQKRFVEAILQSPCHIVATLRSATEWVQVQDERSGKNKPERVGLKPEQGKGIEYEFDILLQINTEHIATVEKDRSGKFQDQIIEKPGIAFGRDIAAWLSEGVDAPAPVVTVGPATDAPSRSAVLGGIMGHMERVTGMKRSDDGFGARCVEVARSLGVEGKVSELPTPALVALSDALSVVESGLWSDDRSLA